MNVFPQQTSDRASCVMPEASVESELRAKVGLVQRGADQGLPVRVDGGPECRAAGLLHPSRV